MDDVTVMYRAYLLRLWRTPGTGWRATLQDPSTGQRRAFATLALLMEFLEQLSGSFAPRGPAEGKGPNV
ncbi:MAG: hypothetical protein IT318_02865 [Anaerolineales bacterium]|nr:hypothetical protein [Anaerolineales bacterium]